MTTAYTPNLGLPYPDENSPADIPADIVALVDALDILPFLFAPGDLKTSAAANPPAGWLLCDGTAVSRTTYPKLYAAIGVAFGPGDGTTTFNVPDYRGRAIVGAGAGAGLTARALGAKGGEEAHVLAIGEMPSHDHGGATGTGQTAPNATGGGTTGGASARHTHTVPGFVSSACTTGPATFASVSGQTTSGNDTPDHHHAAPSLSIPALAVPALSIASQGGGAGHNVMQPFATANVFIKT